MKNFIEALRRHAVTPTNLPALFGMMSPKLRKVLDLVLLIIFVGVSWINGVPGFAFAVSILYSFWQYTDGYISGVETMNENAIKIHTHAITISNKMREKIQGIMPGQAMSLQTQDGVEFTIVPSSDFEHILGLAGLRATNAEGSTNAER